MSEVYVFLADGFEEIEGLTVVDLLRRADIPVETVSIMDTKTVCGSHGILVKADTKFKKVDFKEGAMLVLPGGLRGTENLRAHEGVKKQVLNYYKKGKQIAAICAAPTVFGGLGLLDGKKATVYPGMDDGLGEAIYKNKKVVTDGNVTTGRALGAAIPFALRLIEILRGEEAAAKVADAIVYKEKSSGKSHKTEKAQEAAKVEAPDQSE